MRRRIDYGERGSVIVVPKAQEIAFLAVEEVALAYLVAVREKRPAYIALSGGSTPIAMFDVFKNPLFSRRIEWDKVQLFWGDERWVPLDDDQSNAGEAKRGFIDDISMDEEHYHPWPTQLDNPTEAAEAYEASIRIVTNTPSETPVFDLVFLGMGDDGHTASLFPGTDAIHEQRRLAVANAVPGHDDPRLTMTPPLLNNAREIMFLVNGDAKAEMLHHVLDGPIDVDAMPSQIIRPTHGRVRWLVDEAAAARLERG